MDLIAEDMRTQVRSNISLCLEHWVVRLAGLRRTRIDPEKCLKTVDVRLLSNVDLGRDALQGLVPNRLSTRAERQRFREDIGEFRQNYRRR